MQRNRAIVALFLSLVLLGCNHPTSLVYVDVDKVLIDEQDTALPMESLPQPPPPRGSVTMTVLGAPAVALDDPANRPKQSVQEMFDANQATAFKELERRLQQLYRGQAKEFSLIETKSLALDEQKEFAAANDKIRTLFDAWATERAPTFAQLALIEGFPLPRSGSNLPDKAVSAEQALRKTQADKLRKSLTEMDAKYKAATDTIVGSISRQADENRMALKEKVEKYASDLEKGAEIEAKAQIREAVSRLRFQLADPTPISFPELPARQVSIPAEKTLDAAPVAPPGGILGGKQEQRRLLEHELRIWLALNRYTLAESGKHARDATSEFQTWRQQHGAGP